LVLICAALSSETCGMIQRSGWFAVNVLSEQQRDLSQRFADPHLEGRRFEGLAVRSGQSGLPLLPDVAASLECKVTGDHLEGDHRVFIGQVVHAERSSLTPLLFLEGRYGTFAAR
jgi:flavin reductase (DIM6/NTAB) family NADH-FMN oxidoreductase RutF